LVSKYLHKKVNRKYM